MNDSLKQTSTHKTTWLVPFVCLLAGGALTGISTNVAKYAIDIGLTPLGFLFWSITGAAVILLLVALIREELPSLNARSLEYYFVAALVSVAAANLLLFSAIPHVGAGFVALILSLPPLLTYLGALILRIEKFYTVRALGVIAALIGAGVLAVHKFSAPDPVAKDRRACVAELVRCGRSPCGRARRYFFARRASSRRFVLRRYVDSYWRSNSDVERRKNSKRKSRGLIIVY